ESHGAIERVGDEYPVLCFGERGVAVMKGEESVDLVQPIGHGESRVEAKPASGEARPLTPEERECFEGLRALRRRLAQERGVPPYVIFADTALRQIAMQKPTDDGALLAIKGIGRRKLEEFGETLKAFVRDWEASEEDASDVTDADPVPWR
ncbi:MAG: HRDC domain-containing protein, partial [Phycisphaerales bacterium]|nr:HRDC domain-containing protein [Phycisphaerales bacterium]